MLSSRRRQLRIRANAANANTIIYTVIFRFSTSSSSPSSLLIKIVFLRLDWACDSFAKKTFEYFSII